MRHAVGVILGPRGRWVVLAAWLVLVAVLAPLGLRLPDVTNDELVLPGGTQTAEVRELLRERFPGGEQRPLLLVYRREGGLGASDRAFIVADARGPPDTRVRARLAARARLAGRRGRRHRRAARVGRRHPHDAVGRGAPRARARAAGRPRALRHGL